LTYMSELLDYIKSFLVKQYIFYFIFKLGTFKLGTFKLGTFKIYILDLHI